MSNARLLDPTPYRLTFSPLAKEQLELLAGRDRQRVRGVLAQIAEMAAFTAPHSRLAARVHSLVAAAGEISIRYAVDDEKQLVEVVALSR